MGGWLMCRKRLQYLLVLASALAWPPIVGAQTIPAEPETRVALVIGNSAYVAVSELPNPKLRVVDRPVARSPGGERQRVARVVMSVSASVGAAGAVSR